VVSDQAIRQRAAGFFVLDRIELGPDWGLTLGVRGDRIRNELDDRLQAGGMDLSGEQTFSETTGRVAVAWSPRSTFGMYASWGQGFMPPATEELANNPDHLGGFNMHLVPATSHSEEIGVRGVVSSEFAYDATFFRLDTENDFGRYRVPGRPLETFYRNAGSSRRYGLETSLGWFPTPSLSAQVAYTFSDFVYTNIQSLFGDFTDKVMPNAPRHQAGIDVQYTWRDRWFAGVSADLQSLQYVDQTNLVWTEGYALVNPRVGFRWKGSGHRGEVMLTSRNVFGKEYIAFTEPDPDGNSFQPGPTREVFLGLRVWMGR
jgi:iron complex outermembrane receptor protein